jgi:cytoskeletal protein CcmA (bactofilin family)
MNLNNLTSSFMPEPTSPTSSKNVLANDVDIKGTIKFENELIFDGKIEGEIVSDAGSLTIGKNASVHGEVKTKSVVVHGSVTGNISVTERCELKASSQLTGDLRAMRIVIEEGATFIGKSEVTPNKPFKNERTSSPSTSAPAADASRKNQPATAAA